MPSTDAGLRRLVRDRGLITRELHLSNAWYGHAMVLRRYAGWGRGRPLPVSIEHGPYPPGHAVEWRPDAESRLPLHLCGAPWRARQFSERTGRRSEPIGPLIRYAVPEIPRPPERRRTLVFPAHSSHHLRAEFELEELLEHLERLRKTREVVVCLYWRDVATAEHFERRGFRCVTAGHMYDRRFLDRLGDLLGSASDVFTNGRGTHIYYAVLLERPVALLGQAVRYSSPLQTLEGEPNPQHLGEQDSRLYELFGPDTWSISREQAEHVEEITGASAFRTPAQLEGLFRDAERDYARMPLRDRIRVLARRERAAFNGGLETLRSEIRPAA